MFNFPWDLQESQERLKQFLCKNFGGKQYVFRERWNKKDSGNGSRTITCSHKNSYLSPIGEDMDQDEDEDMDEDEDGNKERLSSLREEKIYANYV